MIRTIVGAFSPLLAIGALITALVLPGNASASNRPAYIPSTIIVGPDSTSFIIKDESRGKTVYYYCAFLSPHNTGQPIIGTHPLQYVYVPAVQCNR